MLNYLKAGYSHFYVKTEEMNLVVDFVETQIATYSKEVDKKFSTDVWSFAEENDPLLPLIVMEKKKNAVMIMKNLHWFLKNKEGEPNPELIQFIQDRLDGYRSKSNRRILVIVSNESMASGLPKELAREFVEIIHNLPGKAEIQQILTETIELAKAKAKEKKKGFSVTKAEQDDLIKTALGMTRFECQNSFFKSLVDTGKLDVMVIAKMRMAFLEGVAGVKYVQYKETFTGLKGLDQIKFFSSKTIRHELSLGICLLGPAGTGKSHFGKSLSGEFGIPMLTIDPAEWQGGIVGETEERVRKTIEAICLFEEVIVFIDEMEKGFSGIGGDQTVSSDSISERAMSQWLKFMQDREYNGKYVKMYVIATCNDIKKVPAAYLRAERWDTAPFFVDLPNSEERQAILQHYKNVYNVSGSVDMEELEGFTGAELKALCRIAKMFDTPINQAMAFVIPISRVKEEEINELRAWAKGRTLPASTKVDKLIKKRRRSIDL